MEVRILNKKQWAQAGVWAIGAAMYICIFAAFMLLLSVRNPQLLRASRTAAIVGTSFPLLLILLSRIYGGFRIGEIKCRNIIYSLGIAAVLTDVIAYLQLQVMNVNEANNDTLVLFDADLLLLAMVLVVQFAVIIGAVLGANRLYFRHHPPMKCVIIAPTPADCCAIRRKLERFQAKYQVCDCVQPDHPEIRAVIRRNEAAFLYHLPADKNRELVEYCYKHARKLYFDMNIEDILARNCDTFMLDDIPMTAYTRKGLTLYQRFFKRAMDIVLSLIGIILLSPVMLACAIAIKRGDGGPVFFRQTRMSRDGQLFDIIKFRTMAPHAQDMPQHSAQAEDPRITRVGRVLRRFRLDELPQLFNIFKGEMSVVGPRPEMLENIENYMQHMPEFAYRNRVKAGLTGNAQVNGKYNTPPREKLMMDIAYIEDYSFWLDIKLILKTLLVLFSDDSTEPFGKDEDDAE